ncbi:MAG: O-antigen ligase family protein [Anaerolineae bacterium]
MTVLMPITRLARACAWISLLLLPFWTRFISTPPLLAHQYVTRFVLLIPMLLTILLWLLGRAAGLRKLAQPLPRALWAIALMGLALWGFASLSWAFMRNQYPPHPEVGETAALQWGLVVLFVIAAASLDLSPRAAIGALTLGLILNGAIALAQVAAQQSVGLRLLGEFVYGPGVQGISLLRAGDLVYLRPYALMPHPNIAAGLLLVGTLAACAGIVSPHRAIRWLSAPLIAAGVLAILLIFSRAAWGGLVIGGIILLPFIMRHVRRDPWVRMPVLLTILLIAAAGVWFFLHYQPFILSRTGQVEEGIEMRSIADRLVFTEFALQSISERPLLGVGIGNFPWRTSYYLIGTFYDLRGDNVHNIYLAVWAELGTPGLLLYLIAIASGIIAAVQAIRRAPDDERLPHAALLAIAIALLAIGWLDHYPYTILHLQVALWGCLAIAGNQKGRT